MNMDNNSQLLYSVEEKIATNQFSVEITKNFAFKKLNASSNPSNHFSVHVICGDSVYAEIAVFNPDFKIPKIILDYLDPIATSVTPTGERIAVNSPPISVPKGPVAETENKDAAPSGTFGHITAENHNVYECYASPFISRRLIDQTIHANESKEFSDWNPFPANWLPEPCLVTRNLIGYSKPRQVHPDALIQLRQLTFLGDDTILGRIQYSSEATNQVSSCLQRIPTIEMVPMDFQGKDSGSIFGYKEFDGLRINYDIPLASVSSNVKSPYALSAPMAFKCIYEGFKVKRAALNPGLSVVKAGGIPLNGWVDTINHNFNMVGPFAPRNLTADKPSLREAAHVCTASRGKMALVVSAHIFRTLKKK